MNPRCRACESELRVHQRVAIRGADTDLWTCPRCGLFEFPDPTWLDAAYADPISTIDVGLASRCVNLARVTEALVRSEGLGGRRLLDYGGGYGLLTRLVRDRGLDMNHHDPFADNLFAQGLEGDPTDDHACVTMVEVFEHLTDPAEVLRSVSGADLVVVSTILVPQGLTDLSGWYYLIPDLGQHITFYTRSALEEIGRRCGYHLTSDGFSLHVFHRRPLSRRSRLAVRQQRTAGTIGAVLRRRAGSFSLAEQDVPRALASLRTHQAGESEDA